MPSEMKDHVYKILELVGSSERVSRMPFKMPSPSASKTIREMKWFEVVQTRGHIEKGSVRHYQVSLRLDSRWRISPAGKLKWVSDR